MNKRFYLIDLLRAPILYTIVWFHSYNYLYGQEYNAEIWVSTWSHVLTYFMRVFAYGGQWIYSISCFLIGYRGLQEKQTLKYVALFFIGIIILTVGQADAFLQSFAFEWDIYHFLFINLILIYLLQKIRISIWLLIAIGSFLLLIPFWNFDFLFSDHSLFKKVLIGDFTMAGEGAWALFPWSGLTFLFYGMGKALRDGKINWSQKPSTEYLLGLVVLGLISIGSLFYFYPTPIGPGYYARIFKPPLLPLVGINMILLILLRVACIEEWNFKLSQSKWVQFVAQLNWNQKLALTYLAHLLCLFLASWLLPIGDAGKNFNFGLFDIVSILGFFAAEILSRFFSFLYARTQRA
jgi:hypothetical protein